MNASSPVKRRVLGALDPNACSPSKARRHEGKLFSSSAQQQKSPTKAKSVAPRQAFAPVTSPARGGARVPSVSGTPEKDMEAGSRKRRSPTPTLTPAAQDSEPAAKRACLDSAREDTQGRRPESPPSSSWTTRTSATTRPRSASPDTPSVFDNSAADNSQVTILTEPDTTGPAPVPAVAPRPAPRARPRLTREQAREKAEIIRLRLGLASYKVRTGQTDVPLDRLEAQHAKASSPPASLPAQRQAHGHSRNPTSVSASFPPPGHPSSTSTTTPGTGSRRPLPGAPLRRASSGASVSFEREATREATPSRSVLLEEARLAIARDERRQHEQQQQQQQQQPRHYQHHQHPHQPQPPHHNHTHTNSHPQPHHHQRRQSEALGTRHDARRYVYGAEPSVPPRPRTAAGVTGLSSLSSLSSFSSSLLSAASASTSFGRRASFVGDVDDRDRVEEEDEEGRGGAASGLLSLARS